MIIAVSLPDRFVESYLEHYNAVKGTKYVLSKLSPRQLEFVQKAFATEMQGEMVMRTDDHSGFETHRMFNRFPKS